MSLHASWLRAFGRQKVSVTAQNESKKVSSSRSGVLSMAEWTGCSRRSCLEQHARLDATSLCGSNGQELSERRFSWCRIRLTDTQTLGPSHLPAFMRMKSLIKRYSSGNM